MAPAELQEQAAEAAREPPLLEAQAAVVRLGAGPATTDLTVQTRGSHALLVGGDALQQLLLRAPEAAGHAAFAPDRADAAAEVPRLLRGRVSVHGADVATAAHLVHCGIAPRDPLLPPRWRVEEYLRWAARLRGVGRGQAKAMCASSLARLDLSAFASHRLQTLKGALRRAVVLAAACVADPRVLIVEDPFREIVDEQLAALRTALERASAGRRLIVTVPSLQIGPRGMALARDASDVLFVRDGLLLHHCRGSELLNRSKLYEIVSSGPSPGLFVDELQRRGMQPRGGPNYFILELPPAQDASVVLAAAQASGTAIHRCLPLLG